MEDSRNAIQGDESDFLKLLDNITVPNETYVL